MVSYGPDIQNCNFTHMYSFVDYKNPTGVTTPCTIEGSIYDYISKRKDMCRIKSIIDKANMIGQLSDCEANFTLFIPTDNYLEHIPQEFFDNMDVGEAKQIIQSSMMWRSIDKKLISSSPVSYYITKNPQMRMYVTNIGGKTRINNCGMIKEFDIELNNGMIHITDMLIVPTNDTFMN